jgi:hypothetical protein
MQISRRIQALLTLLLLLVSFPNGYTCSMYKITLGGKTMVGTNFDAFYTSPRIWFERAVHPGTYGAVFSGGRVSGVHGFAPQSGMNEAGLTFSRLASATPEKNLVDMRGKKRIPDECSYLKEILHGCRSVAEVRRYISQYDHRFFKEDVFIYIEPSGRYLIVEPYTMTEGADARYVLSNFCPSVTDAVAANKLDRYRKGVELLQVKVDTTAEFCRALSDSMHVCRPKVGDGTLLTSHWNLQAGIVTLYFYHDYQHAVHFNLREELAKGNHYFEISTLFPPNAEFQQLLQYRIPQNTPALLMFLLFCGGLFSFTSLFFLVSYIRTRKSSSPAIVQLLFVPLGIVMAFYMWSLVTHVMIFYSPSPYQDYVFTIQNIMAYVPFLMALLLIPLGVFTTRILKTDTWSAFSKVLVTANTLVFMVLICLFWYWGLFGNG